MFNGAKGLWNVAKEKIMKERGELPNEEGDAVRECGAGHEENFWSNWQREDERGKEEKMTKAEKMKKEVRSGKEKRRKTRTKRRESKEEGRFGFCGGF